MRLDDGHKVELAKTLAEDSAWINFGTALDAINILEKNEALRVPGRRVAREDIPIGATARLEYDVLTKNHLTGAFVTTRHMEVTSRKVPDPTAGELVRQRVANVRYFIVEEAPKTMREKLTEAFEQAPGCLTDRGLAEYLLAKFDMTEKSSEDDE